MHIANIRSEPTQVATNTNIVANANKQAHLENWNRHEIDLKLARSTPRILNETHMLYFTGPKINVN